MAKAKPPVEQDNDDGTESSTLPDLQDGERVTVIAVKAVAKKTRPPEHYTLSTLGLAMSNAASFLDSSDREAKKIFNDKNVGGIGRAASRPDLLQDLVKAGFLEPVPKKKGKVRLSDRGVFLVDQLQKADPALTDIRRTAEWEMELDNIATGKQTRANFKAMCTEELTRLVQSIASLPPIALDAPGLAAMEVSDGKPTPKMLAAAVKIAEQKKLNLPRGLKTSFNKCKEFLNEHMNSRPAAGVAPAAERPPSPASLKFAESIAKKLGVVIPPATLASQKGVSDWINSNK